MNTFEERLDRAADRYRQQGYRVTIRPNRDDLPGFAEDFHVEILATRGDGGVLTSAKESTEEFEKDPDLSRYADAIEKQPKWRYDVFVLGPSPKITPRRSDAREASPAEVSRSLDEAGRLAEVGFGAQAVVAAWAALESAMRHRLRSEGRETGWGTSPRTLLNELRSSGNLQLDEFRDLERHFELRNTIVHGFSPPSIEPSVVPFLVDTARRLLQPAPR